MGDPGLIPGSGRSPGVGNGNPLQYTCQENSGDRGACWATVHGVTKSQSYLRPARTQKGFPGGSMGEESAYNAGDMGLIPELGRCPGEGNDNPLQYPGLENTMDKEAWRALVHKGAKSQL